MLQNLNIGDVLHLASIAKIDLGTIFDHNFQQYCTTDYVKVNRIVIHRLLHHVH